MFMHDPSEQARTILPAKPDRIAVDIRMPQPHEYMLVAMMTHAILLESGREQAYPFANVLQGILQDLKRPECEYLLACVHGQVAGQIKLRRAFHDLHNCQVLNIEHVYIARPFRGNGIYRQLHDYAIQSARNAGITEIRLHVVTENDRAARAYEKQGMNRCATLMTQAIDGDSRQLKNVV